MTDTPGKRRVLVVEDEDDLRHVLGAALLDEGYALMAAADGIEGLSHALAWRPHVILLDLIMPKANGWTFIRECRRQPGPHAAVIGMSALVPSGRSLPDLDLDDFCPKPWSVPDLLELVAHHSRLRTF